MKIYTHICRNRYRSVLQNVYKCFSNKCISFCTFTILTCVMSPESLPCTTTGITTKIIVSIKRKCHKAYLCIQSKLIVQTSCFCRPMSELEHFDIIMTFNRFQMHLEQRVSTHYANITFWEVKTKSQNTFMKIISYDKTYIFRVAYE